MNYYCLIDILPCLFSDYTTGETSAAEREIEGSKREERSSGYVHELELVCNGLAEHNAKRRGREKKY